MPLLDFACIPYLRSLASAGCRVLRFKQGMLHAKAIVMDEDGDLALARLSPQGMTVLSQAHIFDTVSWTAPTLIGTTLYARDREKIVALNLGR